MQALWLNVMKSEGTTVVLCNLHFFKLAHLYTDGCVYREATHLYVEQLQVVRVVTGTSLKKKKQCKKRDLVNQVKITCSCMIVNSRIA